MKAIGIVDKIIEGIFKTTKPKLLREYILVGSALFQEEGKQNLFSWKLKNNFLFFFKKIRKKLKQKEF